MSDNIDDTLEDRFVRIETKLSFSEDLLDELNRTVFRQQQQIDRLNEVVRRMHAQLSELRASSRTVDPLDEVPPHY